MVNDENGDTLPPGWVWVSIDEILNVNYGKGLTKSERDSSGVIPVYGSAGVTGYHTEALTAGATIIIGRKGAAGAVHLSKQPCWVIDTAYFIEPPSELSIDFLYYAIGLLNLNTLDKSTAIPSLSRDDIYSQYIPIAPLAEQQRIVEAIEAQFTRLDAGVAALKRLRASLRRYKAAVLKAAAEGRLVEQDPDDEPASELLQRILKERRAKWEAEQRAKGKDPRKLKYEEPAAPNTADLPDLPEGWVWASLDSLLEMLQYGTSVKADATETTGVPVLRMGNIQDGQLDLGNLKYIAPEKENIEKYTLADGDLLINRTNSPELVGKTARFSVDRAFVFASYLIRLRINPQASLPDYIACIINSPLGQNYIAKVRHQVAGQANINSQNIREFPIPFTSLNEQGRITEQIEQFFSIIEELQGIIDVTSKRAERLRQSILREAFAGRLVPQDPDDEPAGELLKRIRRARQADSKQKERNGKKTR